MASVAESTPIANKEGNILGSNLQSANEWIYSFLFDTDIQNRYLIKNYEIILFIICSYVLYVKWIGPYHMKNRKPYDLKNVMIIYNFLNAAFSLSFAVMVYHAMANLWNIRCGLRKNNQYDLFMNSSLPLAWVWLLNKHFDLLDTVFFVLRKKNNHVSILHVFHHGGEVLLGLYLIKNNVYGIYLFLTLFINSSIHVVMYMYYGLAAFGPHMQKYLWWKKYITQMQIAQFVIVLLYLGHGFATGCELMESHELTVFSFLLLILILFLNFYRKSYKKHQN